MEDIFFGNYIVGYWVCTDHECEDYYEYIFPRSLENLYKEGKIKRVDGKFLCPKCNLPLEYDEAE